MAAHLYAVPVGSRGGFYVTHELDSAGALHRIETEEWDLLITDIELPGMSGLELLDRVRRLVPGLPVAVLTGHPSVDYAVTALRKSAAEFMQKPVAADDLVAKATELVEAGRKARAEGRPSTRNCGRWRTRGRSSPPPASPPPCWPTWPAGWRVRARWSR